MNSYQRDVQAFHVAMEMPTGDYSAPKVARPDLRISLITEEYEELRDAYMQNDLVEVIDACVDLAYVTYGAGVEFGVDLGDDCRCEILPGPGPACFAVKFGSITTARRLELSLRARIAAGDLASFSTEANWLIDLCHRITADCAVPWRLVWDEVHASNVKKAGGGKRADGKALKPAGWTPPDIRGILVGLGATL